jgi:hypothetical protein
LSFIGWPAKKLVLFKCDWFDNSPNGTKVDNNYGFVEVKQSRRYTRAYDPLIFAQQAEQVYYTPYPEGHNGWLGITKVKARGTINVPDVSGVQREVPYQDDEVQDLPVLQVDANVFDDDLLVGDAEEIDGSQIIVPNVVEEREDDTDVSSINEDVTQNNEKDSN